MARMQADLETVRLAELYAAHPLLRTMPVPHVRLPEVELDIPVLIRVSEPPRARSSARGGTSVRIMRRRFDELLSEHLTKAEIELSNDEKYRLDAALDECLKPSDMPQEISGDVRQLATDLARTVARMIDEFRPRRDDADESEPPESSRIGNAIKEAAQLEFLKLRTRPPRLFVSVTSSEIREAGDPNNVTRLRLKVVEEGLEWVTIEGDVEGDQRDKLVPE